MKNTTICPYYAKNEDICDVGCGYITTHDAKMIIKFCSTHFEGCHKFRELSKRIKTESQVNPSKNLGCPAAFNDNALPLPLFGLFSLGCTTALYALTKVPFLTLNSQFVLFFFFLGAVGQISSGLNALKKNPLRAVAFTGFGLFWLSLLALDILPRSGYGLLPSRLTMASYFFMWGVFSLILCQGVKALSRTCRLVFALLTVFLLLLSIGQVISNNAVLNAAIVVGLITSFPGILIGLRHFYLEAIQVIQLEMTRSNKAR